MLGAIIGDMVGSIYERQNIKYKPTQLFTQHSQFTDDTVCNIAILDCYKNHKEFKRLGITKSKEPTRSDIIFWLKTWCREYEYVGYGKMFRDWINSESQIGYKSWGNGGAMRILLISEYLTKKSYKLSSIEKKIKLIINVTHNSPEAVKGAVCIAELMYFIIAECMDKKQLEEYVKEVYYPLNYTYKGLIKDYKFDVSTENSIPQAIWVFLNTKSFEDCLKKAVSIGGDTDTICAISCALAENYYNHIPLYIVKECLDRLPDEMLEIIES